MRRIIFSIAIILFLTTLLSQPLFSQDVSGGIKGGLTISNLYIDREEINDENARFGFHAGLYSQMMFSEIFGFQPELLFTTKGTEAVYDGLINQTVQFNLNYLELPLLAVFRPIEILEFHVGPYIGLLLSSDVKYSGTIEGESEIDRDNFQTLDYGMALGVAMNFGMIKTGIRYNIGLQKLANSNISNMMLGDGKNSYGQIFIAINFSGN